MAGKEAIVFIVDVSPTMARELGNTGKSRLDFAKQMVGNLIKPEILFYTNRDLISLVVAGSDQGNELWEGGTNKENVFFVRKLEKPNEEFIKDLNALSCSTQEGCIYDCIEEAVLHLDDVIKRKKYSKRIFLITDGEANIKKVYNKKGIKDSDIDVYASTTADMLKNHNVFLNVICAGFYDEVNRGEDAMETDSLFEFTVETNNQLKTKSFLTKLVGQSDNVRVFSSEDARSSVSSFKKKKYRLTVSYNGDIIISSNLKIAVKLFHKSYARPLPSLKKYSLVAEYSKDPKKNGVIRDLLYYIKDDEAKTPVEKESIIKAYSYGNALVPISEADEARFKPDEEKIIKAIGFTNEVNVPHILFTSSSFIVIPNKSSPFSKKSMNALVHEMIKMKKVLIVKSILRNYTKPKLAVLYPCISKNVPIFYMNYLPTIECIREYQFNSLKKSSPQQQEFIGGFIDSLDLGNNLKPKNFYNPTMQYFFQVLETKAFEDESKFPELSDEIKNTLLPNKNLFENNKFVSSLYKMFPIKEKDKIDEKKKRVFWKDVITAELEQKLTSEKLEEKLKENKEKFKKTVGNITPIEDFQEMIANKEEDLVKSAFSQMQNVIESYVQSSYKGAYHKKAIECIQVLRDSAIDEDEADSFNQFMIKLLERYPKENSEHSAFWDLVISCNLTLISNEENDKSGCDKKASEDWFGSLKISNTAPSTLPQELADMLNDLD